MSKRVIALALAILAFFIFIGSPFEQAANAIAGVDDAVIAVVIAALAAMGITFGTTGGFNNLSDYVRSLLNDYASSRGLTTNQLFSGCQMGSNSSGQLLINNRFVQLVEGFATFVQYTFSLGNNDIHQLSYDGYYMSTIQLVKLPWEGHASNSNFDYVTTIYTVIGDYPVYIINAGYWYVLLSFGPATVRKLEMVLKKNGQIQFQKEYYYELTKDNITLQGGVCYLSDTIYYGTQFDGTEMYEYPTGAFDGADIANAINSNTPIQDQDGMYITTGVVTLPSNDPSYTEGDGAVIDVGASWGDTFPGIIDDVIGAFSDSNDGEATIDYQGETQVQEQVEDTPAQAEQQEISQDIADYQVLGLQNVFPFCIPFDIYNMLAALNAPAEAPVINWRFYVPGIIDQTLVIDLSVFNSVAAILRTMELLAFIVGLAYVTREKFIRG